MRNDELLKQIGARIKRARKAKKLSLEKFGEISNLNMSNLWFIEQGRIDFHILTLKKIADNLDMDVKEFL